MSRQFQFNPRQQDVAILSAAGDTSRVIAKKLELTEYTVKDHLKDIFKILGIKNRSELFPKLLNLR
ncbi:MAG: helix-turn-helix transcriptional regulator [Smithella sp.]